MEEDQNSLSGSALTNDPEDSSSSTWEKEEDEWGSTISGVHGWWTNSVSTNGKRLTALARDQVETSKDKGNSEQEERTSDAKRKRKKRDQNRIDIVELSSKKYLHGIDWKGKDDDRVVALEVLEVVAIMMPRCETTWFSQKDNQIDRK